MARKNQAPKAKKVATPEPVQEDKSDKDVKPDEEVKPKKKGEAKKAKVMAELEKVSVSSSWGIRVDAEGILPDRRCAAPDERGPLPHRQDREIETN